MLTEWRSPVDQEMCMTVSKSWFRRSWLVWGSTIIPALVLGLAGLVPDCMVWVVVTVAVSGAVCSVVCAVRGWLTVKRWPG